MSQTTKIFSYNNIINPILWLKADKSVTLSGSTVSNWADQSGNGNDATQSTQANQPLFVENVLNGKPVLRFDGTNDLMVFTGIQLSYNMSYFFIYKKSGNPWFFTLSAGIGGGQQCYVSGEQNATGRIYYPPLIGESVYASVLGSNSSNFKMISIIDNYRTIYFYENSVQINGSQSLGSGTYGIMYNLGHEFDGSNHFYSLGDIAEIIIYNSALSDSERQYVEKYLKTKYGF